MTDAVSSERRERLDEITSLSRSPTRFEILDLICDSPRSRAELQRELDIHRTTLQKNLGELVAKNWVEDVPTENIYRALPAGRIITESVHETMADFRAADKLGMFLAQLPETPPVRADVFRTCDVTLCESHGAYAPMERFVELVNDADFFRGFAPVFNPFYVEALGARIADGCDFEIIGPPDVFEAIRIDRPKAFETAVNAESTRLLVADDVPQFGLGLLEGTVVVAAYDEHMRTHSILEACDEREELVEWAERQYDTQREAAKEYKKW